MPDVKTRQMFLIDRLYAGEMPAKEEFAWLLTCHSKEDAEYLFKLARQVRENIYGKDV